MILYFYRIKKNNKTDGENYVFEDTSIDEPNAAILSVKRSYHK